MNSEDFEWDEQITVRVTFHVSAKPDPEQFNGLQGRAPSDAALSAGWTGGFTMGRRDGWADMIGEVDVVDVELDY